MDFTTSRGEDRQGGEQPANNSWERADDERDDEIFGLCAQIARWICQQLRCCFVFSRSLCRGMVMIHFHSVQWKKKGEFHCTWVTEGHVITLIRGKDASAAAPLKAIEVIL